MRLGDVVWRSGCRSVLSTIRSGLMAEGVSGLIEAVLSSADIHGFPFLRQRGRALVLATAICVGPPQRSAGLEVDAVLFGGPDASVSASCRASFPLQ